MTNLTNFQFNTQEIRVVEIDSEPWFVCADILQAMQSSTTVTAVKILIQEELGEEFVSSQPLMTEGGKQNATILSEGGLTFLVSRSRTDTGKALNRWIHTDVLPQIRKTGQYKLQQLTPAEMILKQAEQLVEVERKQKELEEKQKLESQRTDELNDRVKQHDAELERIFKPDGDYFSIRGYAKLKGYNLTIKEAKAFGRKASKLSKDQGYSKEKITDPRYGEVGCYSEYILAQVMD